MFEELENVASYWATCYFRDRYHDPDATLYADGWILNTSGHGKLVISAYDGGAMTWDRMRWIIREYLRTAEYNLEG